MNNKKIGHISQNPSIDDLPIRKRTPEIAPLPLIKEIDFALIRDKLIE